MSAKSEIRADHGASGPAMIARPKRTIETIIAGVDAVRYEDSTLADVMFADGRLGNDEHRFRRIAACEWLAELHRKAYPPRSVVASYGQQRGGDLEEFPDPDAPDFKVTDAIVWNRRVYRDTRSAIGVARMHRLHKLAVDEVLTVPPEVLCADLDILARHRGIS